MIDNVSFLNEARLRRARAKDQADAPPVPTQFQSAARFVAHYVRGRPVDFAILFGMVLGAAALAVLVQVAMKGLVDAMAAGPGRGDDAVWAALGLFIGFIVFESVLWRFSGWLGCRATIAVGRDIRLDLLGYLTGHPMRFFAEHLAGSLGHRVTATAGNFGALVNTAVWRIVPPVVEFAGALIVFLTVDVRMALALAAFVMGVTALLLLFGKRGAPFHRTYAERAGVAGGELVDIIANIWSVKAFSARGTERQRLADKFDDEAAAQRRSWMYMERIRVLHDVSLWIMAGSMLVWAVHLWSVSAITPGQVVVVSALTFRILHGSRDLAIALVEVGQQFSYIGETLRLIGQPHGVRDLPGATPLVRRGGRVEFRDVAFEYNPERPVLRGLRLEIPAGQRVGIVGPSGAGKSTLVGLVQRLVDAQGGEVLVDGQPVWSVTQDSLRAAIAVVPQEIALFHRSVLENIRFGRPGASDEDVRAAARAAYADDFIRGLPQGYDTIVGERGTKLSGGQRQRVGIARAFLKDAPILILDEATSALDTESEIEVQRALDDLMVNRTVLAVAHRLSTLVNFDRILVMLDGRIVEDGTPMDLVRRGGLFERLWRLQADGLSLDEALAEERRDALRA